MRCFETTRQTVTEERENHRFLGVECDFCGVRTNEREEWPPESRSSRWHGGPCYREEAESLELKCGDSYPEGGSGAVYELDICPRCFEQKILPLALESRRAPREYEF